MEISSNQRGEEGYKSSHSYLHTSYFLYFILFFSEISQGIYISGIAASLPEDALPTIWMTALLCRIVGILYSSYISILFGPSVGLISSISLIFCGSMGLIFAAHQWQIIIGYGLLAIGSANVNIIRSLLLQRNAKRRSHVILGLMSIQYGALIGSSILGSILSSAVRFGNCSCEILPCFCSGMSLPGYLIVSFCGVSFIFFIYSETNHLSSDPKERERLLPPTLPSPAKPFSLMSLVTSYALLKASIGLLETSFPSYFRKVSSWSTEEFGGLVFCSQIIALGGLTCAISANNRLLRSSTVLVFSSGLLSLLSAGFTCPSLLTLSLLVMASAGYPSAVALLLQEFFETSPQNFLSMMFNLGLLETVGLIARWAVPWYLMRIFYSPSLQLLAYAFLTCSWSWCFSAVPLHPHHDLVSWIAIKWGRETRGKEDLPPS